jgi:phosphopantothenoylcysteine decarboxylase/phosphopantothenate--cysteine ligase
LKGKRFVISAGGTQEPIDPVRVITNRSSGKQGYAIAQAALDSGAEVTLVTAPTNLVAPAGVQVYPVKTAAEMLTAILDHSQKADVLIMAAAVADFTPSEVAEEKIKKDRSSLTIELKPTKDILLEVANRKAKSGFPRIIIGFAAESEQVVQNATAKVENKKLDLIVANDISQKESGFEVDTNRVIFIKKDGSKESLPILSKYEVAERIIQKILPWLV